MAIFIPEPFDTLPDGTGMPVDWVLTFGAPGTTFSYNVSPGGIFPNHKWYAFGGTSMRRQFDAASQIKCTIYVAFRKRADIVGRMFSVEGPTILPPPNDKVAMVDLIMEKDQSLTLKMGQFNPPLFGNTGHPITGAEATFFNNGVWYFIQLNLEIPPHPSLDPFPIIADLMVDGVLLISDSKTGSLLDSLFGGNPGFQFLVLDGTGNSQLPNDWAQVLVQTKTDMGEYPYGQKVAGVNIVNGGIGYSSPTLIFSSSTGGRAAAHATTDGAGIITLVTVDNPGKLYSTPVTVTVLDPTGSGAILEAVVFQPNKRASQMILEPARRPTDGNVRVSQMVVERAMGPHVTPMRISQMVIELARRSGPIVPGTGGWKVREA